MGKRDLDSVLGDVLGMIPEGNERLVAKLKSIRSSALYCPPEGMYLHWNRSLAVLAKHIGQPEPGWQTDVAMCFRGER